MISNIYKLNIDGNIDLIAIYTLSPKKALINYIMQYIYNNYNTWTYPDHIDGIKKSKIKPDHYYYDLESVVIASYPKKEEGSK